MDCVDWRFQDLGVLPPKNKHWRMNHWAWRLRRLSDWIERNPGWTLLVILCAGIAVMLAVVGREL